MSAVAATVLWDGGGDGTSWHDPLNWDGDALPGLDDDVVIDVAANPTVVFNASAGDVLVRSLTVSESMRFDGGSLTITDLLSANSPVVINDGGVQSHSITLSASSLTVKVGGNISADYVEILDGGILVLDTATTFGAMEIASGGVLTHSSGGPGLRLTVSGDVTVHAGGSIDVSGKGYSVRSGPGAGGTEANNYGSGGGYGGVGGDSQYGMAGGSSYGSVTMPLDLGSGGGSGDGGPGGGAIWLEVGGVLRVDGSMLSDGPSVGYAYGGGSGGSIYLVAGIFSG